MSPTLEDRVTISRMSTTPTMADVGKHAGVGIGTVSRVLNGSVHVSDATRKKVRESAELLGYQRTRKSAAERGKGGRLIAVLVPFFDEQSAFQRLRGIVSRLAPHGCSVVLHNVESPAQARAKLLELPRSLILDGLVVITLPLVERRRRSIDVRAVPHRAHRCLVPRPVECRHRRSRRRQHWPPSTSSRSVTGASPSSASLRTTPSVSSPAPVARKGSGRRWPKPV